MRKVTCIGMFYISTPTFGPPVREVSEITDNIVSVQTRLDDSSSKYMGKYRAHHYFLARGKASKVFILVFRVQT